MALETKQPEMEEKIKQDNLKIQDNKVKVKKEPEDPEENGEIGENMNNILNRMVQLGDKVFVPVSDEKEKIYNLEKTKKDFVLESQYSAKILRDTTSGSLTRSAICDKLNIASHKDEQESEKFAEEFLSGNLSLDDFLTSYVSARKNYHLCKTKGEKFGPI